MAGRRWVVLGVLAAVLAATLAVGVSSGADPRKPSATTQEGGWKTAPTIAGIRGKGKLLAKLPRLTTQDRRNEEKQDELEPKITKPLKPVPRPKIQRIKDPEDLVKLDKAGRSDPLRGLPLPKLPGGRTIRSAASSGQGSASTDFKFFRNQVVPSSSNASYKGEPSVGNDRNVILFTGNKYAAVSTDNGINFSWVDPKSFPSVDGGYCCDQVVNASDEDGNELIAWLLQYYDDGTDNTIRIVTYAGKDAVVAQDYCVYDFKPSTFGLSNRWLDFNTMQNSDEWLYMSSNIFDFSDDSHGSVVYRMKLDDLTDGNCTLNDGSQYYVNDDNFSSSLVQHAGSTMYWAVHDGNDELKIMSASDSGTDISVTNKSITPYTSSGTGSCKTPDNNNPCSNMSTRLLTGWTANGEVGWLWNVYQGDGYDFPHVRGAIFKTSNLSLSQEPDIWNEDYAWVWPAVGVNNRGHIGGTIYRIGGGEYPRARAFIVDDVDPSWASLTFHGIKTSADAPDDDKWGDYGGVSRYDGCSYTWQAGVFTQEYGGAHYGDAEPRYVWFGRERDGCPDLEVELLAFLYSSSSGVLYIGDTTRNIGSGTAGASKTRFYLSKDADKSSDDKLIEAVHDVPSLDAGATDAKLTTAAIPAGVIGGTYYLIGCADDTDVVEEITNTNNCKTADRTMSVATKLVISPNFALADLRPALRGVRPGQPFRIIDYIVWSGEQQPSAKLDIHYYLATTQALDQDPGKIELGPVRTIDRWLRTRLPSKPGEAPKPGGPQVGWSSRGLWMVTVPDTVKPGSYYLHACVTPPAEAGDSDSADNCRVSEVKVEILPGRPPR